MTYSLLGALQKTLSIAPITTARLTPELFPARGVLTSNRALVTVLLACVLLVGFGLRAYRLDADGLSEDELNKLRAVEDYRAHGLTSANGEHPMLMKALQTASLVAAERWNASASAQRDAALRVQTETALRLPGALFGALTSLLIFLVVAELFGSSIGLLAAALWALDPAGIAFNRIAKEDTFLLFFFLLANFFWLRGQRAAESGARRPQRYYWATAAAFGAMMASKYLPHLIAISISYYFIFQAIPATRWRMGRRRFVFFFAVMGVVFVMCNPAILLPGTWYQMRIFAGEHRIGHDSYEFMGRLYRNQFTLWLKGVPWYFYYTFMAFKLPLTVVAAFLIGLPRLAARRLGDGRYFIILWLFYWFFPFPLMGGKFLRYLTVALPAVLITAAFGIYFVGQWLGSIAVRLTRRDGVAAYVRAATMGLALSVSAYASVTAAPNYRLYTNALGGGTARAGTYFPHDEFYDGAVRDAAAAVVALSPRFGARVATETPELFMHYARLAGRDDLRADSLSDPDAVRKLTTGDFVLVARGRRYFSNESAIARLQALLCPATSVALGHVPAVRVYTLDEPAAAALGALAAP